MRLANPCSFFYIDQNEQHLLSQTHELQQGIPPSEQLQKDSPQRWGLQGQSLLISLHRKHKHGLLNHTVPQRRSARGPELPDTTVSANKPGKPRIAAKSSKREALRDKAWKYRCLVLSININKWHGPQTTKHSSQELRDAISDKAWEIWILIMLHP